MKKLSKIFAVALVLAMALSVMSIGAAAANVDCTKITSLDQLVDGQYAIIGIKDTDNYAMGSLDGSWITVATPTISGTTATVADSAIWTIDYDATAGTITLKDSSGNFVKPKGGNNNGISGGADDSNKYNWNITCTDGVFAISGTDADTVRLAFNLGSDAKSRGYKTSTLDGTNGGNYIDELLLFKTSAAVQDTREDLPTTSGAIVDAIFKLEPGEALSKYYKYEGDITLTGVVAGDASWSDQYNNGTVNFKVKDSTGAEKTLQAFRFVAGTGVTVDDIKGLTTGDTITVKGSAIKNYNGTFEFDQGCVLVSFEKGKVTLPALPTDTKEIVDAIFELKAGESLNMYYDYEDFTLTGTVVGETSWSDQYSNGELTIKVDGTDKELKAFRYKAGTVGADVAAALAAGDKVTFKVESAKNYNGTYEMEYPVLTAVEKNTTPAPGDSDNTGGSDNTGDSTNLVLMMAVMALSVCAMAVVVTNKKTV